MRRRQALAALGGGLFVGPAAARKGADQRPESGGPLDRYTGPMISAHEHLLFLPEADVSWLVDWMDEHRWRELIAFSVPAQLDLYEARPNRFIPYNQEPFSRYLLPKVLDGVDGDDVQLPPFLPSPDDPPALEALPSLFEASLDDHDAWEGIGEIGLHLLHQVDGDRETSRPDADWLMELYGIAADHDVTVMVHPPRLEQYDVDREGDLLDNPIVNGLERAFDAFPDTQFLVHGFRPEDLGVVGPLLEAHDNWYYDVSGIMFGHGEFWTPPTHAEDQWGERREWVDQHMTASHIEDHVEEALDLWGDILTGYPDRVLWGIDSGRPWHFYRGYLDVHDRFYRRLLGRLPRGEAQQIAHVNARRLHAGQ